MTGMNEQDRIRADTLEHLRQDIRDGLDSGPATSWSPDEAQQEGRQRQAERRQRDRQVLTLEDFTEEDLKAILAVEPSPAAAGFDDEAP
jgi:hypothetical protein